jgi:beta-glucosidase
MKTATNLSLLLLSFTILIQCTKTTPEEEKEKLINKTIAEMTLEQKTQLVVGTGMFIDMPVPEEMLEEMKPFLDVLGWFNEPESAEDTAYTNMVDRIRTYQPGTSGITAEFPDLGITSQVMTDGPAGLRMTTHATAFPIGTLLASSWNVRLMGAVGKTMGNEVLESGTDIILGPGMNLHRDPLCGRNFEYYSEDPLLTGKMAAAIVNGIQSNGVGTSVKHFAVNNQETSRMNSNSILSARALREMYLKGFEIVVKEAQPWTVMSSYNYINGIYASESYELLTTILRDEWGFEGYVVTDWSGGSDLVAQMKAGNDLIMPGRQAQWKELIRAVENGELEEDVLDTNIRRILKIMLNTPRYRKYEASGPDLKANAEFAREAATEGLVLLKNENNVLPVSNAESNVAAFGNAAYEIIIGGTGSGDVNEAYSVSLIQGLVNGGFEPDNTLEKLYLEYIEKARMEQGPPSNPLAALMGVKDPVPEMNVSRELATKMAASTDVALITIGRNAGEGGDRKAEEGDFYLTSTEKELIQNVSDAFHAVDKKVIVILNIAGVIETSSWMDLPDAILCAWQAGQEAGNSIMDIVSGKVNPSGKLTMTFPKSYDDTPAKKNFPGTPTQSESDNNLNTAYTTEGILMEVPYEEDIYVGYRYYNTFEVPVSFEFGYGLSYTSFDYLNLEIENPEFDGTLKFSAEIKNTGSVAGKEAVQFYVSAPGRDMDKPAMELVTFGKTRLLEPGESEILNFQIDTKDIASFDESSSSWVAEQGTYTLSVGASCIDIRHTAEFTLVKSLSAGEVSRSLLPEREIEKLYIRK